MDSFMYQTVGHEAIEAMAGAMAEQLPLFRRAIGRSSVRTDLHYEVTRLTRWRTCTISSEPRNKASPSTQSPPAPSSPTTSAFASRMC
jgi:hypothetical protein